MKNQLGNLMKQAQEMQQKMQDMQAEMASLEVIGESGGGLVKVTMTGERKVKRVDIDDSLLSEDKDILEDMTAAAVNAAVDKVEAESKDRMSGMTGGLNLPAGMKFPF